MKFDLSMSLPSFMLIHLRDQVIDVKEGRK